MFRANHAFAIKDFLEKFRRNPAINISSAGYLTYILWALKLKGDEKRPLTEDEVRQLLCRYSFFGSYLTRLGLWINQPEIHKYFLSRIILHIPHSSFRIPFPDGYVAKAAALLKEQLLLTDLFTDDLFNHPDTIRVIADFSRVFCDVERFPEDSMEVMAKKGMGVLYEKKDNGRSLRKVTPGMRDRIITDFYNPHHQKLENAVENQLELYGQALILDCHSFPDTPLRRDLNQQPGRPDFNIGTDPFHTPQAIVDAAVDFFRQEGFTLGINRPYEGTMVPAKYFRKDNRVMSIMLEVNRKLYLVPGRALKSEHYDKIRGLIFRFLEVLGTTLETFLSGTVQNK